MTQNIYDKPEFFDAYSGLGRSVQGLDGAPEWAALKRMLPNLKGLRIVDLGCGFGWFCRWAQEQGAAQVLGVDVSEKMLARARAINSGDAISYKQMDLEQLEPTEGDFDLAYSSLAFHYVEDAARLYRQIYRTLVPGGHLVFSTEHPIFTAPAKPGWLVDPKGGKTWPVNHYLMEGPRTTNWLADGVVKYHRTIGTTLNLLIQSGFKIDHVEEFAPTAEQIVAMPALAEELERPMFLLITARR